MEHISRELYLGAEHSGLRLDQALAQAFPEYSRSFLTRMVKCGSILVDGQPAKPRVKVAGTELVTLEATLEASQDWSGQDISLDVVYEDESLIVINKAPGMVVHPGAGNPDNTLVNALAFRNDNVKVLPRFGIVHRLDKDTSGLMVAAKTLPAYNFLVAQLQQRAIKREYEAVVTGQMISGTTIDAPIGRHARKRTKMAVVAEGMGKEAVTHVRVVERFPAHTRVRCQLETGRTHQIRVHMAHIRFPLLGDPVYGDRLRLPPGCSDELKMALRSFRRQALHACALGLEHPDTGKWCSWQVPLPADMQDLIAMLSHYQ